MKSNFLSYQKLLNFLIYLFPLSFILGNFLVNIEIFLISIIGIIYYKEELIKIRNNNILILIVIFFAIIILSTIFESLKKQDETEFIKSVLFLRYLVFLFVLRCMILNDHLDLKKFLISCLLFSSFVSIDIIFQYFYGKNILGFELVEEIRKGGSNFYASGVFDKEVIAGGFIQRFFVLGFFSIPFFIKKREIKILISVLLPLICFLAMIFSGNRMPVITFSLFLVLFLFVLSFKKLKYIPQLALIFIFSIFVFSIVNFENFKKPSENKRYEEIRMNFMRMVGGFPQPSRIIDELRRSYPELEKYKDSRKGFHLTEEWQNETAGKTDNYDLYEYRTGYTHLYITAIDLISGDPIIGRGIRSFRSACWEKVYLPNRVCQNHAHNFYLEILTDTGFVGLLVLLTAILFLLIMNFRKYNKNSNLFFYAFFFSLIIEFFPIRSTGSFFSTSNAAFIFFLIGVFIGLKELKNKKSNIFYKFF